MRWDPLHDLLLLGDRRGAARGHRNGWVPPADLLETRDAYLVVMELPGLERPEFDVEVSEHEVTVRGNRCGRDACRQEYLLLERGYGTFARRFSLALPVAVDGVAADFVDGVLTITLPKLDVSDTRKVQIV